MTLPTTKLKKKVIEAFRERLGDRDALPYDEYVEWALYSEEIGYYRSDKERVGRKDCTDFYTSSDLSPIWGELLVDACKSLLAPRPLAEFAFVEIAAEPNRSVLSGFKLPFKEIITYRWGDSLEIPENAIVFSNEWLDAQPFKRFLFSAMEDRWMELGVREEKGHLKESPLSFTDSVTQSFPSHSGSDYLVDWPSGSISCLSEFLGQSQWTGLFLTFDYGLSFDDLFFQRPTGTSRTSEGHKTDDNLLLSPGEKDITCHLCWDSLKEILRDCGFSQVTVQRQESFLINNAASRIKEILNEAKGRFSPKLQSLKELIHPQHLGSKFQALWGIRENPELEND